MPLAAAPPPSDSVALVAHTPHGGIANDSVAVTIVPTAGNDSKEEKGALPPTVAAGAHVAVTIAPQGPQGGHSSIEAHLELLLEDLTTYSTIVSARIIHHCISFVFVHRLLIACYFVK